MTKLQRTPLYSTFLRVEELLEQHKPLEALEVLDKELDIVDADEYLHVVRRAYVAQAKGQEAWLQEVDAAWHEYEAAATLLLLGADRYDPTSAQRDALNQLRRERETRLQAAWELLQAVPAPVPLMQETTTS